MSRVWHRKRILILCVPVLFAGLAATGADLDYHYEGRLALKPAEGFLKATWQISVKNHSDEKIRFLVRDTVENIRVWGEDVAGFSIGEDQKIPGLTAIEVHLKPVPAGGRARAVHLDYSGVLLPEPLDNNINSVTANAVELGVDSFWFPIDARFSKMLTAELDILLPKGWQGVSSGTVRPTERGLTISNQTPMIDIAFTLAPQFVKKTYPGFTIYDLRQDTTGQDRLADAAAKCMAFLNQHFGAEDPLPPGRFVITTRKESGYARKNYIVFTDIKESTEEHLIRFVAHELAHYWSSAGKFDTVENWLNESFAEYAGLMAVRRYLGESVFRETLAMFKGQVTKELPPIWTPETTQRGPYLVLYRKGPLALAELEDMIGEETFLAWFKTYMTTRKGTTPALLDDLEALAGKEVRDRFTAILAR